MTDERDVEVRLAELGSATAGLGPRPGFSARVMSAIRQEPATWTSQVVALSWRLVPALAVVAVAVFGWALQADRTANDAVAASYGTVEMEW